jgi:hypothetical protein
MKAWLASGQRQVYADAIMELEIFEGDQKCCDNCELSLCRYRCEHCFGGVRYSKECIVKDHARLPLHWVEVGADTLHFVGVNISITGMEWLLLRAALA